MTKISDIQIPLGKVHKVDGSDQQVLDMLFDLEIEGMTRLLDQLHGKNEPMFAVIKLKEQKDTVLAFMFMPPDIWLDFDHQKYQVFLAPNLNMMIHYFGDRRAKSRDTFEISAINMVIDYLERHLTANPHQRVSHTWRT
jgi:hypothetical protein